MPFGTFSGLMTIELPTTWICGGFPKWGHAWARLKIIPLIFGCSIRNHPAEYHPFMETRNPHLLGEHPHGETRQLET